LNRFDRVREVLRLEGLAAAANRRAREHRTALEEEARAELAREGTAPSWRSPDIGTVALPLTTEAAVVADIDALTKWVTARYPTEVETVPQIRAAFQAALLQRATCDGDVVVDPGTGEVIPGLAVRQGGQPKTLTITASRDARAVFARHGDELLASILAAEAEPVGHLAPGEIGGVS
jgi:hypothetical protein